MKKVLTTLILVFSLFTTSFAEYYNDEEEDLLFVNEIINTNTETFSENIEYCQFVFMSWRNPLNEVCDFEEVKRSLFVNF